MSEAQDTVSLGGGMVGSEDRGEHEGYGSAEDDTGAEAEENIIGKLAARLAEMGGVVRGEEEVMELVERERWVRGGGSRGWVGSMVAEEAVVLFWDVDIDEDLPCCCTNVLSMGLKRLSLPLLVISTAGLNK
ncbi:hypothetical protein KC331_g27 [Hortaea werneckii]|nr:hypothetical protein KC331_g27 [Hortaea werneckii]